MNLVTPSTDLLAVTFHVWEHLFMHPTAGNLCGCIAEQELALCGPTGSTKSAFTQ